jgi:hypothetical protein
MRSLRNHTFDLIISRPLLPQIKGFIASILFKESTFRVTSGPRSISHSTLFVRAEVTLDGPTIEAIIVGTHSDLRQVDSNASFHFFLKKWSLKLA